MPITTLNVCFDESGKEDREVIVFGGIYATAERWELFSREWNVALRRKGINHWHTVDANNLSGEFKKFRGHRKELDTLTLSLADILCRHAFGAQMTHVTVEDYRKLNDETRKRFKGAFYCAFQSGIKSLVSHPYVEPNDRFNLLCDDSEEYSGECLKVYRRFRKLEPALAAKVGSLCFVNDESYPPIQAADLMTFCRRRELEGNSPLVWKSVLKKILDRFSVQDSSEVLTGDLNLSG